MYTDVKSALEAAKKAQTLEELMTVVRDTSAQAESGKKLVL